MAKHRSTKDNQHHLPPTPKAVRIKETEKKQRQNLLWAVGVFGALIALILIFGIVDATILTPNRTVATVDDTKITVRDYQARVRFERWKLITQYYQISQLMSFFGDYDGNQQNQLDQIAYLLDSTEIFGEEVLNLMIEDILIAQEAEKLDIMVNEEDVDASMQEMLGYYANGTPTPTIIPTNPVEPTLSAAQLEIITATPVNTATAAPDQSETDEADESVAEDTAVDTAVDTAEEVADEAASDDEPEATPAPTSTPRPTATPYTFDGYLSELDTYLGKIKVAKINEKALRKIIHSYELRSLVYEAVTADVEPYEEQVWARHILLTEEQIAQSALYEVTVNNGDFGELAKLASNDTGSAQFGGDLGWFGRGQMIQEFEDAAFELEVGEISPEPVQSQYGYHIIQVLGRDPHRAVDATRFTQIKSKAFEAWLSEKLTSDGIVTSDGLGKYTPSDPALYNADVIEAITGINPYDSAKTATAEAKFVSTLAPEATAATEE
ncbi:MAG: peptidylprolyl isomerase [Anaerolineaceae bacterium]|nr:peptidylprolyl isomerase [Anaerolineaceae bacterium]